MIGKAKKILAICLLTNLISFSHSHQSMSELLTYLRHKSILNTPLVMDTMKKVDRNFFCASNPYEDMPQSIGYGATISAPHIHVIVLESIVELLKVGSKALDLGSGSGYITVCMALILGKKGVSIGVDHIPELTEFAKSNTEKYDNTLISSGRVKFVTADGRLGYPEGGPYDVIYCGANFPLKPMHLMDQLKPGGRFIGPIGASKYDQYLTVLDKGLDGKITETKVLPVVYMNMQSKVDQMKPHFNFDFKMKVKLYK